MSKDKRWSGWRPTMSQERRRAIMLREHGGSYIKAARALQGLSNMSVDTDTKVKADADAQYFFNKHKARKQRKK